MKWLIATLLLILSPIVLIAQDEWTWVNPLPQGNPLNDVIAIDGNNIIAVGWWGAILRTTDGGRSWDLRKPDSTLVTFRGLTFVDQNVGVAVGEGGAIYKTTDGGYTWSKKPSGTTFDLNSVSFTNPTTGAIVGQGGPIDAAGVILTTSDGGETWRRFIPPLGSFKALYGVSFASPTVATAVGRSKTTVRTTDGGTTWFTQSSDPNPIAVNYLSITYSDMSNGWIGGPTGEILHTSNGGETWTTQVTGQSGQIDKLEFFDSSYGLARAPDQKLLKTTNGGVTWTTIQLDSLHYGMALSMISRDSVVTVGNWGYLGGSVNGGLTWATLEWMSFTLEDFSSLDFFDLNLGIASMYSGKIFRTTDGGGTWSLVYQGGEQFLSLSVADPTTAFAVSGGLIKRTTDTGLTWTTLAPGTGSNLLDIDFVNASIGIAVGVSGTILRTTDRGDTWETQVSSTSSVLWGVSLVDASIGFAVGDSGIALKTTNGGMNWGRLTTGTAEILYDICFVNSSTGTAVGSSRTVLRTDDGGTSWTDQVGGGILGENFWRVKFLDENIGIVVGDSCVLRTSDGGSSWANEFVGSLAGINGIALNIGGYDFLVGGSGLIMRRLRDDYGNYPPAVSDIPNQSIQQGGRFAPIRVDNYVFDPNDPDSLVIWTWSGNTNLRVTWNPTRRRITVRQPIGWSGSETVTFTATDPEGLSDSDVATFKVGATDGPSLLSQVDEKRVDSIPREVILDQNYPNPFNPSTVIRYGLPKSGRVRLEVFDVLGQTISVLVDEEQEPGYHKVSLDGLSLCDGVYFYRLSTEELVQTKKLTVLH